MSSSATQNAVRGWIAAVTGLLVIEENDPEPAAPRPGLTYAAIGWRSDVSTMSTPYEETTDTPFDPLVPAGNVGQYRALLRSRVLAVEVFGPGAADYVFAIELSLGGPAYCELLAAGDIAVHKGGQVSDEPVLRSTEREPDCSTTLTVGWTDSEIVSTNWAETIVPEIDGVTP